MLITQHIDNKNNNFNKIYKFYDNLAFMKTYIKLLQSNEILRRLSFIQLIVYFGAWFSNVAIYTLLLDLKVSASVVAFVAMLHFLAGVIQAPFSGTIIDRVKPKVLMLILILIEVCATLFLIFVNQVSDLWLLYLLIFFKMAAASFYFTTEMSLLPKLLDGNKLQKANELHSIIWSFSYTLGMALSGFVVYSLGITTAFLLDTLMFVIAFFMLQSLKIEIEVSHEGESVLQMMGESFSYLKKNTLARHLMILHSFVGLTAFDALVALMVDKYYASIIAVSLALGLLHSSRAIGLVVGPLILSKFLNNRVLVYIFIAQGVSLFIWAYMMHNFYFSLIASVIVGLFATTLWSYTYTLLQNNIEKKYYGRIVAYNDMLFLSAAAFTSFMIGFLATHSISLEVITTLLGVGFFIGALYWRWIIKYTNIKEIDA